MFFLSLKCITPRDKPGGKKLSFPENFYNLSKTEKLKLVLKYPNNVCHTAQYLVNIMDRRSLLNKVHEAKQRHKHAKERFRH